jgi:thymidylate kinase
MLDTKLVLIEGPPGSGKSTTAQKLSGAIAADGHPCRCFYEWDAEHPIPIGSDLELRQVIDSAIARESEVLRGWQHFAQSPEAAQRVTVLESRFWQTSLMLMYAAGHPLQKVLESSRRVNQAVRPLQPVLITFAIRDPRGFAERTIALKEREWQESGFPGSWMGHVQAALDPQPWFTQRGLTGLAGYVAFLEEWAEVAEILYTESPFRKLRITDPHQDWARTMRQLVEFLALDSDGLKSADDFAAGSP